MRTVKYDEHRKKFVSGSEDTKRRIYEFILEYRNGVKPDNIWKSLGISRQWVHEFLRKLKEENKIFEDKDKYYPVNSDLNNIYLFATRINRHSYAIAVPPLVGEGRDDNLLNPSSSFYSTPLGILARKTFGPAPSNEFCKTSFAAGNMNEKYLFEFSNRIGAYITYMFMESMRPSSITKKNIHHLKDGEERKRIERNERAINLIFNAVDLTKWYQYFCELFSKTKLTDYNNPSPPRIGEKPDPTSNIHYYELDRKRFNKLSRIFEKVYPGIYSGLEECWSKIVEDSVDGQQSVAGKIVCKHKWEETKIYKYPKKCYRCNNCHNISHSKLLSKR
jgi:hypothetical protein